MVKIDRGRGRSLRPARLRLLPPKYQDRLELDVDGVRRTYWIPPARPALDPPAVAGPTPDGPPPLLIGLHGLNSSGSRLAWWSGLDRRGPAAGFHCVFPDAIGTIWDDRGCGRVDGADDSGFIARLIDHLAETGAADPSRVVLVGVSSGSTFGELLVRTGAVAPRALALVCGGARVASVESAALPANDVDLLMIAGTDDPITPYDGGPSTGPVGRLAKKQLAAMLVDRSPHGGDCVAAEGVLAEWVTANGCVADPAVQALGATDEGFPVHRLVWAPAQPGRPAVTFYRITGGGHGWPSGKQYLPVSMLGRIPQGFDATAIVLEFLTAAIAPDVTHAG